MPDPSAIDALRGQAVPPQKLFIDGAWRDAEGGVRQSGHGVDKYVDLRTLSMQL